MRKKILFIFTILVTGWLFWVEPPVVLAQVNENSKTTDTDQSYYELADTFISVETVVATESMILTQPVVGLAGQISKLSTGIMQGVAGGFGAVLVANKDRLPYYASAAAVPLFFTILPLLLSPNLLFLLLGALLSKRNKYMGLVFDQKTRKAVPMAVIKAYEQGSTKFVTQRISDLDGRYFLPLSTGKYRIEVKHSNYSLFQKEIEVRDSEETYADDIALNLKPASGLVHVLTNIRYLVSTVLRFISLPLSVIGFLLSLVMFFVRPGTSEIVLLLFYTVMLGTFFLSRFVIKRKNAWGTVVDSHKHLRVSGAIVRIYDTQKNLCDTQMTDSGGRFGFLLKAGKYQISITATGYIFPSRRQKERDFNWRTKTMSIVIHKRSLGKSKFFVDPIRDDDPSPKALRFGELMS